MLLVIEPEHDLVTESLQLIKNELQPLKLNNLTENPKESTKINLHFTVRKCMNMLVQNTVNLCIY